MYLAACRVGNGSTTTSLVPVDVVGLTSGVGAVSAGYNHTCALTNSGGIKCWGGNSEGQLGNGITFSFPTPIPVDAVGMTSVASAVSTGFYFTCALTSAGGIKCWGSNYSGQLGNGEAGHFAYPVATAWMRDLYLPLVVR